MEDFERAADILLSGETVIFPTDTVYGLGAVANNDAAVEKLFEIKSRDIKKPINLLIADYEDLLKIAEIPSREEGKLMEINVVFQIAAVGILVAVLNQVLIRAGREEQAMMTTLAGLVVVLFWVIEYINELFTSVQTLFRL